MEYVEVVVKIPEIVKAKIDDNINACDSDIYDCVVLAVKNGSPLPKGYGKLIDVGQCDRKLFYQQCGGEDSLITVRSAFDMLMSLPPTIDADRGDKLESN